MSLNQDVFRALACRQRFTNAKFNDFTLELQAGRRG